LAFDRNLSKLDGAEGLLCPLGAFRKLACPVNLSSALHRRLRPHAKLSTGFFGITIALLISTAMTPLLIKPWAKLGKSALTPIH
jgi:hypothetical protein